MLFLSRLALKNWRNFQNVDLQMQERMFIVGPNASGKSNLLDAIRFLRDLAKDGGGLSLAVKERGGLKKIRCLAARKNTDIEITAEVGERQSYEEAIQPKWTYKLVFNQEGGGFQGLEPVIKEEQINGKAREIKSHSHTGLQQPDVLDAGAAELRKFLIGITYQHLVPQLLRYPHLFMDTGQGEDHFGRTFIEQVSRCNPKIRAARLGKIQAVMEKFILGMDELTLEKDDDGRPHFQIRYRHWRPHGAFQYEDQLSDGTLRLIGFMWSILDGNHPLLLEEPELSLHCFLVNDLAEAIAKFQKRNSKGRRQVIMSTHSPDLLQNRGIALEEMILLKLGEESTNAVLAKGDEEAEMLLETGATPAEVAVSITAIDRLSIL